MCLPKGGDKPHPYGPTMNTEMKSIVLVSIGILLFTLFTANAGFAEVSASLSTGRVRAGERITISGTITPGEELNVVISSQTTFSPGEAGPKEKIHLTNAGKDQGFEKDTIIPYLYYVVTSKPLSYGHITDKSFGGAFFFSGLYKTKMFKLKRWEEIPDSARSALAMIKTQSQWNFLRYAHEVPFGINTIGKERTCRGKVVIFSRCVVTGYQNELGYWNKGTEIHLDKKTGNFNAVFTTFRHTSPNTAFDVYVNGENAGSYIVEPRGFWLSRGWRYVNPVVIMLGAVVAGTIYSMVGASGGLLMAAFQVMFIGTAGPLGVNGANVLKPSNLPLVFFSPLSGLYRYWFKERRLALPVALAFGIGLFIGSFWIGPPLSAMYLNLTAYKPWLGILVLIMALRTLYELSPRVMKKRKSVKEIAGKFSQEVKKAKEEGRAIKMGHAKTIKFSLFDYRFSFWGEEFRINPALFFLCGIFIGIVNASFGIGGGFLLVPAMTMLGGLPMYVAVPISLFSSMFGCVAGVAGYMMMGYLPDLWIVLSIVVGGIAGGMIGSRFQHCFSERQLKTALAIILFFLVFRFLGIEIWV